MSTAFLTILNMSIAAGWLVLAVVLMRFVLKKAPKTIACLLWALVAVRLCLPFTLESPVSLIPSAQTVPPSAVTNITPHLESGFESVDRFLESTIAADPLASATPLQIFTEIAGWVWLIGIIGMLGYAMISTLVLRRRIRESVPLRENIMQCDRIDTPFLLGLFAPRIYLPSSVTQEQMEHILAHEQAHIARKDHWWKPLGFLLLALHWFNPLIWLGYVLLCRDIEWACDERVIDRMDGSQRQAYSETLLSCSMPRRVISACPIAFGEVGVKDRIKSVLHYKKPTFWLILVGVIAVILMAVFFLTSPEAGEELPDIPVTEVTWSDIRASQSASSTPTKPDKVPIEFIEVDAALDAAISREFKSWGTREHVKGTIFEHHGVICVDKKGANTVVYAIGAVAEYSELANDLQLNNSSFRFMGMTLNSAYQVIDNWHPLEGAIEESIRDMLSDTPVAASAVNYKDHKEEYLGILQQQAQSYYGVTGVTANDLAKLDAEQLYRNAPVHVTDDIDDDGVIEEYTYFGLSLSQKYLVCIKQADGSYTLTLQNNRP